MDYYAKETLDSGSIRIRIRQLKLGIKRDDKTSNCEYY